MLTCSVVIRNPSGLHARPANVFVSEARKYKCALLLRYQGQEYNAKSILTVLRACVKAGARVELTADGEDEAAALDALERAVRAGLGEALPDEEDGPC